MKTERPALVLSGGGARGAYQVGVLCAIAEKLPEIEFPVLTGVSAGAINAAFLASHRGRFSEAAEGLRRQWSLLTMDRVFVLGYLALLSSAARWLAQMTLARPIGSPARQGLLDLRPLRRFLAKCIDFDGLDANVRSGRLRALALSATSYTTGCTVTFLHGAEGVPTWERAQRIAVRDKISLDHVMASSAIPIVFPAVRIGAEFFGDGSVRQTAPLAPAIHLGARRLLAIGMRWRRPTAQSPGVIRYPSPAEVMGHLLHAIFLDSLDADVERLERANRLISALPAGAPVPEGLAPVELLILRPSRDLGAMAREYRSRLPRSLRQLFRGIGGKREQSSDFLSYLLFDPAYTGALVELGHGDALAQWPAIEKFLR